MRSEIITGSNLRPATAAHLQDVDVGNAVGAVAAAVDLDVLQPLDVRLGVAVHLAVELHLAAHLHRLIGWQARLEDGPVGRTLCGGGGAQSHHHGNDAAGNEDVRSRRSSSESRRCCCCCCLPSTSSW